MPARAKTCGNAGYRADIDGLRAIAVMGVVLYHAGGFGLTGGFGGVDVFFVISGYLISQIIKREIDAGTFSLVDFYARRIRRIFPALLAVMVATSIAAAFVLLPDDLKEFGRHLQAVVTLTSNFFLMRKTGYFDAAAHDRPLLHTWSLAVEEQFYLAFPLALAALARWAPRSILPLLLTVGAGSLAYGAFAVQVTPDRAFYSTPVRVWELLTGAILVLARPHVAARPVMRDLEAGCGLALIVFGYLVYDAETAFPGPAALVFCLGAALVIHAGEGGRTTTTALLSSRPLVLIGLISYSVYLWHWPLLIFARYTNPGLFDGTEVADGRVAILFVCLSMFVGYASWGLIERPWRRPGRSGRRAGVFASFALLSLGVAAVAILAVKSGGWPGRWPADVVAMLKTSSATRPPCRPLNKREGWPAATCVIGLQSVSPTTLLWGDSHAEALMGAFDQGAQAAGRGMVVAAMAGCPPLEGVTRYGRGSQPRCRPLTDAVIERLRRGGIETVVLAARWALYAEGRPYGDGSIPVSLRREGAGDNAEAVAAALEETVSLIERAGAHAVIVGPVPEQKFPVAAAVARSRIWGTQPPPAESRPAFEHRQRRVLEVLKKLETEATVIYPDRVLCDRASCRYADNGWPLYTDTNHLSPAGSSLMVDDFTKALAETDVEGTAVHRSSRGRPPSENH